MSIFIGLLTTVLVLICLLLILLVLIQLPKKESGSGLAFGAATTDTLFGAGSGNVLTDITKYCVAGFLGLSLLLTIMGSRLVTSNESGVDDALQSQIQEQQHLVSPAPEETQPASPPATEEPPATEPESESPSVTGAEGDADSNPGTPRPRP